MAKRTQSKGMQLSKEVSGCEMPQCGKPTISMKLHIEIDTFMVCVAGKEVVTVGKKVVEKSMM